MCFKSASCVGAGYGHFGYCQPSHGPSSLKLRWAVGEAVGRCSGGVACWNLQAERSVLALSLRTISKRDLRQKTLNFIQGEGMRCLELTGAISLGSRNISE